MAWKELSKDQKQKFILGLLGAATLLYAVKVLFVDGMVQEGHFAEESVEDVRAKLADYHTRLEPGARKMAQQLLDQRTNMVSITENHLPPRGGEFAWAANQVYQLQQRLGLDITKEDVGILQRTAPGGPLLKESSFVPYTMKATFSGSFAETAALLHGLEKQYPYATISRLNVTTGTTPDRHNVEFILQWPAWADPAELIALQTPVPGKTK